MRSLTVLLGAAIVVSVPASAGEYRAFDAASFQALQNRNAATVVFVHAPWCPVCRAQEQVIKKLLATPEYKDVNILTIDFDSQKALWSKFGAKQQSTLIGFHGRRETARLSYNADPDKVTAVVASPLR